MTSGNFKGIPMSITEAEASRHLGKVADYFLTHDRKIVARCDDSVLRIVDGEPSFLRRSRGWVPEAIDMPVRSAGLVLGLGAELRLVGALLVGSQCYLTQHIGDGENLETIDFMQDALRHMALLTGTELKGAIVARDSHPQYLTSRVAADWVDEVGGREVSVQHHHAHLASLMAEHGIAKDEPIVGVAADGAGYGGEGEIWGGEVLVCSYEAFERVGHLENQPMPGGDLCTKYPLRMCAAMLRDHLDEQKIREALLSRSGLGSLTERDLANLEEQLNRGVNIMWTSSLGRALDAMSAATNTCLFRTYEGEPAMRLEAIASGYKRDSSFPKVLIKSGNVVDTTSFLYETMMLSDGMSKMDACGRYQEGLASALAQIAVEEAAARGISTIGLSGGVAINAIVVDCFTRTVSGKGLRVLRHRKVPCGDGGIALGQVAVASASA
jgi:hydrogenase maturation protein HypF